MQLWTYHPVDFRLDDQAVVEIDPTKGKYWAAPTLRYEECSHALYKLLGIERTPLWCCTVPNSWLVEPYPSAPLKWELNLPDRQILAFIRESTWDAILKGNGNDWANLLVSERPVEPDKDISALVRFPLSPECKVKCCGKHVDRFWHEDVELLRKRPELQKPYLKRYREYTADEKSDPTARRIYGWRVDYLQEMLGLYP